MEPLKEDVAEALETVMSAPAAEILDATKGWEFDKQFALMFELCKRRPKMLYEPATMKWCRDNYVAIAAWAKKRDEAETE